MKLDKQKYVESRSIKPAYILVALLSINLLLGAIAFVFPEEGISLSKEYGLKFLSKSEVFTIKEKNATIVDVDNVLSGVTPIEISDTLDQKDSIDSDLQARIGQQMNASFRYDSSTNRWVINTKHQIQFPSNNSRALNYFYDALLNESSTEVVRVLHYGDSQLEGDRITDYLRNRLQLLFGGSGPGIILPLEPTAGMRRSAYVNQSGNIHKHAIYKKGSKVEGNKYGLGGASFEIKGFTNNIIGYDTSIVDAINEEDSSTYIDTIIKPIFESIPTSTAYVKISNAKNSYPKVRSYSRIRLLYAADEPFTIELKSDTNSTSEVLTEAPLLGIKEWNFSTTKSLKLSVTGGKFPLLYGIALDGQSGVAVDNFPMRGSAALGFSTMNRAAYGQQLEKLNVKLIVLQYGVNVIPSVLSDYTYYRNMLTKELKAIKAAHPDVSILVIGPSDMSRNKGGSYVSYQNIPLIRDAMKQAAFDADCAFWDLYEAMGGENSMTAWVDKGYASKDYTHFTFKGAKYVGEMLFEALMQQMQEQGFIN